jgi:hypothetical protein
MQKQLRRLTPTAEELAEQAEAVVSNLSLEEKQQWLASPMTKALIALLEAERMDAFEQLEGSPPEAEARRQMAKAEFASEMLIQITHALEDEVDV